MNDQLFDTTRPPRMIPDEDQLPRGANRAFLRFAGRQFVRDVLYEVAANCSLRSELEAINMLLSNESEFVLRYLDGRIHARVLSFCDQNGTNLKPEWAVPFTKKP